MFDKSKLNEIQQSREKWEETTLQQSMSKLPERSDKFIAASGEPVARSYMPLDIPDLVTTF